MASRTSACVCGSHWSMDSYLSSGGLLICKPSSLKVKRFLCGLYYGSMIKKIFCLLVFMYCRTGLRSLIIAFVSLFFTSKTACHFKLLYLYYILILSYVPSILCMIPRCERLTCIFAWQKLEAVLLLPSSCCNAAVAACFTSLTTFSDSWSWIGVQTLDTFLKIVIVRDILTPGLDRHFCCG